MMLQSATPITSSPLSLHLAVPATHSVSFAVPGGPLCPNLPPLQSVVTRCGPLR